ncbi:MAG: MerR family transcriptional regulator [Actinomycetota bacterium]|nr:MerR family transcriptional regulator [Actinomycetota bacterium]
MELMTIGAFAERTRLSAKALRLYDRLGLLTAAQVDPVNGYRLYGEDQVESARLVGLLRCVGMPLSVIAEVLSAPPGKASGVIGRYWAQAESVTGERRALVFYIQARLTGADMATYEIQTRSIPGRRLAAISRHLHADETDAFFVDAFARLRAAGPGLEGIAGCPFLVFYGEVSDDSDGPVELCRPLAPPAGDVAGFGADVQIRVEPAHDEAFIRLALKDMGWPAMLPAVDALDAWATRQRRPPAGALRQVLIADQRSATPDTLVCDLTVPLK